MTDRARFVLVAFALSAAVAGCTSDPSDGEDRAPDVDVATTSSRTKKEDLCSHAVHLYWHAADPGEEERALDMVHMFCDVGD